MPTFSRLLKYSKSNRHKPVIMKKALFIIFSLFAIAAQAQRFELTVQSDTTQKPISFMQNSANLMDGSANKIENNTEAPRPTLRAPMQNNSGEFASYPGGNAALRAFVKENLQYPEECKPSRITSKVVVTLTIMPDGTIYDATIDESSGNRYMDEEALRVAWLIPQWTPATDSEKSKPLSHKVQMRFRPGR